MCSLKIHDNVLLSWVSNECKHDRPYVSKITPANKIHNQSCKRNASKVKFHISDLNKKAPTSTLFWCLTSYHIN